MENVCSDVSSIRLAGNQGSSPVHYRATKSVPRVRGNTTSNHAQPCCFVTGCQYSRDCSFARGARMELPTRLAEQGHEGRALASVRALGNFCEIARWGNCGDGRQRDHEGVHELTP